MKRHIPSLITLFLISLTLAASAQQSNKSKSKDRYREKNPPSKDEQVRDVEQTAAWNQLAAREMRPATFALSEVMLHDVASPPAASRFYAYALLAGYETASRYQPKGFPTLQGRLRGLPMLYSFTSADSVFYPLAALWAVLETGKNIMPSGQLLVEKQVTLAQKFRDAGLPEHLIAGSQAAASAISRTIVQYANSDGYPQLNALERYRPGEAPANWQPTPPDWMAAIDPHWNTLRPFFLESAQQFSPPPPAPYDSESGSRFMVLTREVYDTGRNLTAEQRQVAEYWDCNPFAVQHSGHLMIGLKKITPGGHWMNICGLACEQQNRSFRESLIVHTTLGLTMADAFISCWDEKYRSNRVRPITAINRLIDPNWQPLLQTPPFPEYASGHSMVSGAAAVVLTRFLGDNAAFTDHTQTLYGMHPRQFGSFRQAAEEAAVSRLYGGIHFRDAVDEGLRTGQNLGNWVLRKLPTGL
ncbi:MAG: vanadium-dependent haloperoxidase [Saprospiraceae bacterium]|nr:vanadium-dependent haloperoxidase [Saprospiraceae bacterium]